MAQKFVSPKRSECQPNCSKRQGVSKPLCKKLPPV